MTTRQKVFIPHKFPSLNDYIDEMNKNRHAGNNMKQEYTFLAKASAKRLTPVTKPVYISFKWFEADAKRDPDNIVFAKKFILDGLVAAKILPNDNQQWIKGFDAEEWEVVNDKLKVGVMVEIWEVENVDS